MTDLLHVGLIGGGGISATHARAATGIAGVRIAAIQGTNASKVRALCSRHGGTPYSDLDAFLAHRPMEMVIIGSPSGLHAAQGIAAADRGLHVLVEKPIDVTTARADALISAAERAGVRLGVIYQERFKPDVIALKRLVDEGTIGKVLFVEARVPWYRPPEYYASSRWRGRPALDGGGALINQAIHTLDLLVWLLGDVERVQARTATLLHDIEVEDTGATILEFACGALGIFSFTTAAFPGYPRQLTIIGARGSAILEDETLARVELLDGASRADARLRPSAAATAGASERSASPLISDVGAHQAVLQDFIDAVREGRAPRCDGREGRRSLAVVEAIYRTAAESGAVAVDR